MIEGYSLLHQRHGLGRDLCTDIAGQQDTTFFKRLPQRRDKEATCHGVRQVRLTESHVQRRTGQIQVQVFVQLRITVVKFAPREYVGTTQHIRQPMALDQENLQALRSIAQ